LYHERGRGNNGVAAEERYALVGSVIAMTSQAPGYQGFLGTTAGQGVLISKANFARCGDKLSPPIASSSHKW